MLLFRVLESGVMRLLRERMCVFDARLITNKQTGYTGIGRPGNGRERRRGVCVYCEVEATCMKEGREVWRRGL